MTKVKLSDGEMSRRWGLVAVISAIFSYALATLFVRTAVAEGIGGTVATTIFAGYVFWSSWNRTWFVAFITVTIVVHLVAIFWIPWPIRHESTKGDIFFWLVDIGAVVGAGAIIGFMYRKLKASDKIKLSSAQ